MLLTQCPPVRTHVRQLSSTFRVGRKQWAAKAHSRRCKDCVSASGSEESQPDKPKQGGAASAAGNSAAEKEESELCALVRAIKFANPQWGLKKVTKEVASKMRDLGRCIASSLIR